MEEGFESDIGKDPGLKLDGSLMILVMPWE